MTPDRPERKNPRLRGWDYGAGGTYFVTFCTSAHRPVLSSIRRGDPCGRPPLVLTPLGECVAEAIALTGVRVEHQVIMPNLLDFWFSGCIPCKAEIPYMEKLADELKGRNIQFFSLSLDSGEQLMKAWKSLVKEKIGPTLQLNIPGGFQSELAKYFGIRSVPRIVIIDQQGKIVDAFARRPSDPKLRQQLLELLDGKSTGTALTKEEATQTMMAVSRAETAAQKEEIMRSFIKKVQQEKADFAYPMVNMMMSLTVEALYVEGQTEKADKYANQLKESEFKRDVLFMSGAKCFENNDLWEKLPK